MIAGSLRFGRWEFGLVGSLERDVDRDAEAGFERARLSGRGR